MFSALYYPHTQLSADGLASQRLLKRALLMWDHLEFIVPDRDFKAHYDDPAVAEAVELIGRNRCPNEEEKKEAHGRIEEFVTRPSLPDVFYYRGSELYGVYAQKFLPKTWHLLTESKVADSLSANLNMSMSQQAGLAVMAILADCCAGVTRNRVTDLDQAYASLAGLLVDDSKQGLHDSVTDANLRAVPPRESLISLRLSLPDIDSLSLDQLINFRKREAAETGTSFRRLRHNFVERIERQVTELTSNTQLTKSDVEELQDQFFHENLDDLGDFNEGIGLEFKELATPVVITVLAGAMTMAAALFLESAPVLTEVFTRVGLPVILGGVVPVANEFFKARAKLLRSHPLALLYELRG